MQRDWLRDCETCTGPVLVMDVRDSFFQLDPFGPGSPVIQGLQVYEEHKNQSTLHWLYDGPITRCKNVKHDEIMLCSGTTTGTRAAMLKYLEIMYEEMKTWMPNENCRNNMNGDDQSIHNYLFYSGQLPFATAIENRVGIVHTVGVEAAKLSEAHRKKMMDRYGLNGGYAICLPFEGAEGTRWIGKHYNLADDEGFITDFDGSRSRVIHQFDRFKRPYYDLWFSKQRVFKDPIPPNRIPPPPGMTFDPVMQTTEVAAIKLIADYKKEFGPNSIATTTRRTSAKDARTKTDAGVDVTAPELYTGVDLHGRTTTDTGIDVSDPKLYESIDLNGDSSTATVMGMASGYDLPTYESFVGTLRKSGFKGNIILGVHDPSPQVLDYFEYRNVTAKLLQWTNCTYMADSNNKEVATCADPYPDIKVRSKGH
jgi:hypothetical protein